VNEEGENRIKGGKMDQKMGLGRQIMGPLAHPAIKIGGVVAPLNQELGERKSKRNTN